MNFSGGIIVRRSEKYRSLKVSHGSLRRAHRCLGTIWKRSAMDFAFRCHAVFRKLAEILSQIKWDRSQGHSLQNPRKAINGGKTQTINKSKIHWFLLRILYSREWWRKTLFKYPLTYTFQKWRFSMRLSQKIFKKFQQRSSFTSMVLWKIPDVFWKNTVG